MKLSLLETWSKFYDGQIPFDLPEGWRLVTHQMEVYEALHDPEVDVVFDTAMTGDGKSLAALLPLLRPQEQRLGNGVFAYPTNELIRDQQRGLEGYQTAFGKAVRHQLLNGPQIAAYKEEEETTRYSTILDLITRREILLTNPDVFNLIYSFAYTTDKNPATLAQRFSYLFRYVVFDEFHVFSAPQVATVLDSMLFIGANSGEQFKTKFLFLSATPDEALLQKLEAAGLRCRVIEGQYRHGAKPNDDHRKILQRATLEFETCDSSTGGILAWVQANIDRIRTFYTQYPESKGAIICNGVFAAKQVASYLRDALAGSDIDIGENTGLTGKEECQASFDKRLMVATSTVDVGVDFRINLLIFESLNAGTFIQRLGRLGRHDEFSYYHAIALLPDFLVESFQNAFADVKEVERSSFFNVVRENVFPKEQAFDSYLTRWGGVRATQRLYLLHKYGGRDKHATLLERYQPKAASVFRITPTTQARTRQLQSAVSEELRAFRGAGSMDVRVYDPFSKAVNTVNVLRLLSGIDFTLISKDKAEKIAKDLGEAFYATKLGIYARVHSYREERLRASLLYNGRFRDDEVPLNHAGERLGFHVEAQHPEILKLSKALRKLPLCTCATQGTSQTLRRRLSLPAFFELQDVEDKRGANYAVAFGQDALLLDSLIHWHKNDDYAIC